jgi:AraC-like DNA-binding protein
LDVEAAEAANPFDPSVQSIFSILNMRLIDGRSDIEGAARLAGLGMQAFQRLLRGEGLTYRKLLDRARLMRARALLYETNQTVTEIAFTLGYTDHANFTRAFKRWQGCSPSVYRMTTTTEPAVCSVNPCCAGHRSGFKRP